jgi:hypothetical protein
MILFTSGMGLVFPVSGFLIPVVCFFCSASCLFWSADLSGASNLMIFRSGSGFFSGRSLGFGDFVSGICSAGVPDDVSTVETGSSFPNFSFIATPPCELIFAESQGISTRI